MRREFVLATGIFVGVVVLIFLFSSPQETTSVDLGPDQYESVRSQFVSSGQPRDSTVSLNNPDYLTAEESTLPSETIVFGINHSGFVAAYPEDILAWHQVVNIRVPNEKISVTYSPLTGTVIGYRGYELGVSEEVYNSDIVLYDRATDARIPHMMGEVVEGDFRGARLKSFPVIVTTWGAWKERHPETLLLKEPTAFNKDYSRNPYQEYARTSRTWFPVERMDTRFSAKEVFYGITDGTNAVAIQKANFSAVHGEELYVMVGPKAVRVRYDPLLDTFSITTPNLKAYEVYWFSWYAHYPETEVIAQ